MSPTRRRALALLTVSATAAATALTVSTGVAGAATSKAFPNSVPSWATHANDTGAAAPQANVEGEVYLPLRDLAGAEALATAVSTPGSGKYGKTLTPIDWIKTYSPTQSDFNDVVSYLKSKGLKIWASPQSRQFVVFRGQPDAIAAAFGSKLHTYSYAGSTLIGPSSVPTLPSAIGSKVLGVSIDTARLLTRPDSVKKDDAATTRSRATTSADPLVDTPCSSYWGENIVTVPSAYGKTQYPTDICGYIPAQLRSAYGLNKAINSGNDGTGQTVAIVDAYASPTIYDDVNTYSQETGGPALTSSHFSENSAAASSFVDQDACGDPSGWQSEETIDVEAVHGVAPGANIKYFGGFNCGGGLDVALSKILDNKYANIVSNSYGNIGEAIPDSAIAGTLNQHVQAAVEGIGLYFSSGDDGDEVANLGFASPDFPASSPFVTSVGGTSLAVNGDGTYGFELGWGSTRAQIVKAADGSLTYAEALPGTAFRGGAGGGTSAVFAQPAYQKGIVPAALAKGSDGTPSRVSPDVASLADPYTGFLIGYRPIVDDTTLETGDFGYATYGGTSLASPLTAGQVALAQQAAHAVVGFANPVLYKAYKAKPAGFRDIKPATPPRAVAFTNVLNNSYLVTLDRDTTLATHGGYDDVTGLGSFNPSTLTSYLTGH